MCVRDWKRSVFSSCAEHRPLSLSLSLSFSFSLSPLLYLSLLMPLSLLPSSHPVLLRDSHSKTLIIIFFFFSACYTCVSSSPHPLALPPPPPPLHEYVNRIPVPGLLALLLRLLSSSLFLFLLKSQTLMTKPCMCTFARCGAACADSPKHTRTGVKLLFEVCCAKKTCVRKRTGWG